MDNAPSPRVVVFVFERASWVQLTHADTPHLDRLLARGAVGLTNPPLEVDRRRRPKLELPEGMGIEVVRDGASQLHTPSMRGAWPPPHRMTPFVRTSLRRSDALLGQAVAHVDPDLDLLIVLAIPGHVHRAPGDVAWGAMAPVAMLGPGFGPGLLTSASTRRPGIVSNTDIAPTILRFFGLDVPDAMTGHPMRSIASREPAATIARLDRATSAKFVMRPPLVAVHLVWGLLALMAGAIGLALEVREGTRAGRLIGAALLSALALSIGFLLQPVAPFDRTAPAAVVAFGWAALALWAVSRAEPSPVRLGVVCAVAAAALLAATVTRSDLLWRSPLGYEFIGGRRFYGIGNEWMAILVASAAIASGVASDLWRRVWPWAFIFWLALIVVIGAPALGANWGGCLTAAVAGIVLSLGLARPLRWWHAVAGIGGVAASVAAVLLANIGASDQTHIARSVDLIARQGLGAAADLARHRLATSLEPFDYTHLLVLPAVFMLAALVVLIRPWGPWRVVLRTYPGLRVGLTAAVAGGFGAAVLNDSGVVALVTASAVALPSLVYVGLIRGSQEARTGP